MKKLLITRFPLEAHWGGEEELHLTMAQILQKNGIATELLTSDDALSQTFRRNGFFVRTDSFRDITSTWRIVLSIVILPLFLICGLIWLPYFRFKRGVDTLLFLTLIEKIAWTPLAKLLGFRVFWGHHAPLGTWLFHNPYFLFWKWWSRWVKIITPSAFMSSELEPFVANANTILVLPNTLSLNKNFAQNSVVQNSKEAFDLFVSQKTGKAFHSSQKYLIGTANRLSREKGMFDVLAAAKFLQKNHPQVVILCAGTGPEYDALQEGIQENELEETMLLLGFLRPEELGLFFANIDLFVLASHEEPFGIALLEAMSAQKAIAASMVGGIPEVLGNENTGLFQGGNPESLAQTIEVFLHSPELAKHIAMDNKKRFQEYFSPEIFEKNLLRILASDAD